MFCLIWIGNRLWQNSIILVILCRHLGCDCLDGFSGPICEFRDSAVPEKDCKLTCQNNGVCRSGAKDVGFLKKFNLDMPNSDQAFSENFEHCVCPKGYVGLQCENQVMVCPGGEHVCMNGAECLADDSSGRLEYNCDCDSIRLPFDKYTGSFWWVAFVRITFHGSWLYRLSLTAAFYIISVNSNLPICALTTEDPEKVSTRMLSVWTVGDVRLMRRKTRGKFCCCLGSILSITQRHLLIDPLIFCSLLQTSRM